MSTRSTPTATAARRVVTGLIALLASLPVSAQQSADVAEEIYVVESRAMADFSGMSRRQINNLQPNDLMLLEDGAPREITKLAPAPAGSWRLLIFFDYPTTRSRTVRLAAERLATQAEAMAGLGTVEVWVANPRPQRVYGPSDAIRSLENLLLEVPERFAHPENDLMSKRRAFAEASRGASGTGLSAAERMAALQAELELVRRQADGWIATAASGCDGSPCSFLLVSDGFFEQPQSFYFEDDEAPAGLWNGRPGALIVDEVAQTLAGYGWVGVVVPLRQGELETGVGAKPMSDLDQFLEQSPGVKMAPKGKLPGRGDANDPLQSLEISLRPILQPLRHIAEVTSGEAVRVVAELPEMVRSLGERWIVSYLTSRSTDGAARTLELRFRGSDAFRGPGAAEQSVRAPMTTTHLTPAAVAELQIRERFGGSLRDDATAPIPLTAELDTAGGESGTLRLATKWGRHQDLVSERPIRVSIAFDAPEDANPARTGGLPPSLGGRVWVGHQVLVGAAADDEGVSRQTIELRLPTEVDRFLVRVEALVPGAVAWAWVDRGGSQPAPAR